MTNHHLEAVTALHVGEIVEKSYLGDASMQTAIDR
jgi:hypothetical protein